MSKASGYPIPIPPAAAVRRYEFESWPDPDPHQPDYPAQPDMRGQPPWAAASMGQAEEIIRLLRLIATTLGAVP